MFIYVLIYEQLFKVTTVKLCLYPLDTLGWCGLLSLSFYFQSQGFARHTWETHGISFGCWDLNTLVSISTPFNVHLLAKIFKEFTFNICLEYSYRCDDIVVCLWPNVCDLTLTDTLYGMTHLYKECKNDCFLAVPPAFHCDQWCLYLNDR